MTWVWFPAPTWQFTTMWNSTSQGSELYQAHMWYTYIQVGKTLICKKKKKFKKHTKNVHRQYNHVQKYANLSVWFQPYEFYLVISPTWLGLLNLAAMAWLSRDSSGVDLYFESLALDLSKFFQSYALWVWAGLSTNPLLIDSQLFLLCFYSPHPMNDSSLDYYFLAMLERKPRAPHIPVMYSTGNAHSVY